MDIRLYLLTIIAITVTIEFSMALTAQQKTYRRKVVGRAVRLLRERLNVSQSGLARMVGKTVDAGTVSRWERGSLFPQPWKLGKLEEIARKNGFDDIVETFATPLETWKAGMALTHPELVDLITLLEIAVLNADILGSDSQEDHAAFEGLRAAAKAVEERIVAHDRDGEPPFLFDDYQRRLMDELREKHQPERRMPRGKATKR